MKKTLFILSIVFASIVFAIVLSLVLYNFYVIDEFRIGKMFTLVVAEDEILDATYVEKVSKGEIDSVLKFFEKKTLKNLAKYLKKNNYKISPGTYRFNQAWRFKNGYFVYKLADMKEKVFQFEPK